MTVRRIREPRPPRGLLRLVVRAPIWLNRARLGGLLGNRFLLLTHTGRRTGRPRQTVLEVVRRDPSSGAWLVPSGFGARSQWLRNIRANPQVTVRTAWRPPVAATARILLPEESARTLANYAHEHPRAARAVLRLCGLQVDGTIEDFAEAGRDHVHFVALTPAV